MGVKTNSVALFVVVAALVAEVVVADQYEQRIKQITHIPPALVAYKQVKQLSTGFKQARGIATGRDGQLCIVGDKGIHILDASGRINRNLGLGGTPYCVHVSNSGVIYVGLADRVLAGTVTGGFVQWPTLKGKPRITCISSSLDTVWVADAGNRVIWRFDNSGREVGSIGKRDPYRRAPGLVVPSPHLDVVAVKEGLWVANPGRLRLELYGQDGTLKRNWGKASLAVDGFNGCCNPADFAIFLDGRFVTSEKTLPRVKVYTADGKFQSVVASPDAFPGCAGCGPGEKAVNAPNMCRGMGMDVAVDSYGQIYVLDGAASVVRVFAFKSSAVPAHRKGR